MNIKMVKEKIRIKIDGKFTQEESDRFNELMKISGKNTRAGALRWMIQNLKVLK